MISRFIAMLRLHDPAAIVAPRTATTFQADTK
ncbi:hypothetical protein K788_00032170 [Paraburkholderia caribensis MBA4]|uniref:Uncharacterized protein n=1 Tax=Paraburkholderia caribensis MBA4 TaxID=1323664 RepID=A0A0N7JUY0_9BURK|nr:hypothetical protein K788_00032170 [Paraburkholderia caribensis MBA4]